LGFVHIKDMLWVLQDRERRGQEGVALQGFDLRGGLCGGVIVPGTKTGGGVVEGVKKKQKGGGGGGGGVWRLVGVVTVEDVLEQMVGEIHDEFDVVEKPLTLADGAVIFDAALNVRDLDTQYGIVLPEDPAYATVGGFVLDQLGFIPKGGESFIFGDL